MFLAFLHLDFWVSSLDWKVPMWCPQTLLSEVRGHIGLWRGALNSMERQMENCETLKSKWCLCSISEFFYFLKVYLFLFEQMEINIEIYIEKEKFTCKWLELSHLMPGARRFFRVSYMSTGTQALWQFCTAFTGTSSDLDQKGSSWDLN